MVSKSVLQINILIRTKLIKELKRIKIKWNAKWKLENRTMLKYLSTIFPILSAINLNPAFGSGENEFRLSFGMTQPILQITDETDKSYSDNNIEFRPEIYAYYHRKIFGAVFIEVGGGYKNLGGKIDQLNSVEERVRVEYQYRYLFLSPSINLESFKFGNGEGVFVGYEFAFLTDAFLKSRYTSDNVLGYGPLQSTYPDVDKFNNGINFGFNYPIFRKIYIRMKYFYYFGNVDYRHYYNNLSFKVSGFSALISCPISFNLN